MLVSISVQCGLFHTIPFRPLFIVGLGVGQCKNTKIQINHAVFTSGVGCGAGKRLIYVLILFNITIAVKLANDIYLLLLK